MQWNIRGLISNLQDLKYIINENEPDVLLLNEIFKKTTHNISIPR